MPNDIEETPVDDTEPTEPLEVKIVNPTPTTKQWNDSYDDFEYDEHNITDEEIKEANKDGNT